jgi:hypothetical protein
LVSLSSRFSKFSTCFLFFSHPFHRRNHRIPPSKCVATNSAIRLWM